MKKQRRVKAVLCLCIVFIFAVLLGVVLRNTNLLEKIQEDKKSVALNIAATDEEDYVILEIVPDKSYAQLGYWTAGSEPVDIFAICENGGENYEALKNLLGNNGCEEVSSVTSKQYDELEEFYGTEKMKQYFPVENVTGSGIKGERATYQFTGDSFLINKNLLKNRLNTEEIISNQGKSNVKVLTYTSEELNSATDESLTTLFNKADLIFVNQSYAKDVETQQKKLAGETTNTFLTQDKDLNWNVVEKIFQYVANKNGCTPIIFDESIYNVALSDASAKKVDTYQYVVDRTVKYNDKGEIKDKNGVDVSALIKAKKEDKYKQSGVVASSNNVYKLFLMSAFRDPAEFYNIFMETKLIKDGKITLQDNSTDWSTYSFVPAKGDLNTDTKTEPADENYWKSQMAIGVTLPSKNYVNCNVLSIDTASSSFVSILGDKKNFAKVTNTAEKESTLAAMVAQIDEYQPKAYTDGKTFNVLELEPANAFLETKELAMKIDRLIPYNTYSYDTSMKLTITKMTTAEFIGRIDDLASTYDMVYIGDCINGLFQEGGQTYYGLANTNINSDMTGVIYSHVGARAIFEYDDKSGQGVISESASGKSNGFALFAASGDSLGRESKGELRYSGNDITALKKNALQNYISTGLPVAVAASLVKDVKTTSPTSSTLDSNIKKTNYFYDTDYNNLYNFIYSNKSDILDLSFNYRTANADELDKQLSRLTAEKPSLSINGIASVNNSYPDATHPLDSNLEFSFNSTTSNRKITFSYTINSKKYSKFYTSLFIDKNADGIYDEETEKVGQKACSNGTNSFSVSLNTNYHGAFSWKLEIRPTTNQGMKISKTGYGTIRFSDQTANARTVHVLQIQSVSGSEDHMWIGRDGKRNDKHATSWGTEKAHNVQLTYDDSGKNSQSPKESENDKNYGAFDEQFYKFLHADEVSRDFDIKVTLINLQEFCYGAHDESEDGKWFDTHYNAYKSRKDLQSSYDMIIFGFADSFRDLEMNQRKFAQDVEAYIDAGKSVLFTHDLTSQINDEGILNNGWKEASGARTYMETTSGRGFNRYLRDAMGLNRFGQNVSANTKTYDKGYDNTASGEEFGFTYTALMQFCNFRHGWVKSTSKGYKGPYNGLYESFESNNGWPNIDNGYGTTSVTNVNNGQITKYPYDLSKIAADKGGANSDGIYTIAKTHGQYYQLNMEDEDIVCWYALSDSTSSGWYRTSPNDVANNYYIYNKGNVTYTGVGHSTAKSMTEFEKKLFVNTIIAALRAGVEGPTATITNGLNVPENGEDCFTIYADIDADAAKEDFEDTEKVVFYAEDDAVKDDYVYVALEVDTDGDGVFEEKSRKELADMGFGNKNEGQVLVKASNNSSFDPVYDDNKTIKIGTSSTETKHHVWKIARSTSTKQYDYVINYARNDLLDENKKVKSSEKFRIVVYDSANATGSVNGALVCRKVFTLD